MAHVNDSISYELIKNIGILASYETGWNKEVNLISWNGGSPKVDIRDWSGDHEHMSKGITLHENEACDLIDALEHYFGEKCTSGKLGSVKRHED